MLFNARKVSGCLGSDQRPKRPLIEGSVIKNTCIIFKHWFVEKEGLKKSRRGIFVSGDISASKFKYQ